MQIKPHPTHHITPLIIGIAMFSGLIVMAVVLGFAIKDKPFYFGVVGFLAIAETVSAFIVIKQMLKQCQCPDCGQTLRRDQDAEGIRFLCIKCDTVYVSRIGNGRRGGAAR
ncbi:MAG: hypothetical protein AAGB26_01900 [Planctomycetota bacterium]